MKIRVGNGRVPADDDIVADAQPEFAQQDRIGETAVIADLRVSRFSQRKMNPVHRAMLADDERRIFGAVKSFEREVAANDSVRAQNDVIGRFAIKPTARGDGHRGCCHAVAAACSASSN